MPNLEIRDSYFSRLKNSVEEFKRIHREKARVPCPLHALTCFFPGIYKLEMCLKICNLYLPEIKIFYCLQVVIASHSWGDNVFRAFLQWMDSVDDKWTENHIQTYINLAGPVLGVPKSIPAFLSGELFHMMPYH